MSPTNWEIVFRVPCSVRDVSCVRSCGREISLWRRGCAQVPCLPAAAPAPRRPAGVPLMLLHMLDAFSASNLHSLFNFFMFSCLSRK